MQVSFADASWAHALWGLLFLIVLLWWLDARNRAAVDRFLSAVMQRRLAWVVTPLRRRLSLVLWGLACAALVISLMRPQGPPTYHSVRQVGAQIMVCLDVSNSMLAEDSAPNRLERAKAELTDLLAFLQGDQIGLIAFAGRAALLCPLTNDMGFFKLVLDGAGPRSVGRGGTRLEEPLRRAIEGFRTETNAARVILLLTDGEDHDSYPLKAAEEAAHMGIRVIAVGFGDEAGSEIQITDPRTGVRSILKDATGQTVVTRLDGETLRQMALATEGAYVPAGTGALDLESIYRAHIAPLTREALDARGFAIRQDYFPWTILAGLVLLVFSQGVVSGARATRRMERSSATRKGVTTVMLFCALSLASEFRLEICGAGLARAAESAGTGGDPTATTAANDTARSQPSVASRPRASSSPAEGERKPQDARRLYNESVSLLASQPDRAEQLLTESRRNSGTDGELRYCATYNTGWIEVNRADAVLTQDPQQALTHLRNAANWFADAVRLQPDSLDARHNLEVVLRRVTELADSLRGKDERDLAARLDGLVDAQRTLLGAASSSVEELSRNPDPNAAARYRADFRGLGVRQRTVLSDSQAVAQTVREEVDALQAKKADSQSPQEQLRAGQLGFVLAHLGQSEQRMNQARSQLRQQQGERAFRRGSAALEELKRARDQLRDPTELLNVILGDATQLAGLTGRLAASRRGAPTAQAALPPAWLTREYLTETQQVATARTSELTERMTAVSEKSAARPAGPLAPEQQLQETRTEQLVAAVRSAAPFLRSAVEAFQGAEAEFASDQLDMAYQKQLDGIVALHEALERFLDIRGLIERMYGDQSQLQQLLAAPAPVDPSIAAELPGAIKSVAEKNLERCERLAQLLDTELAAARLPATQPSASPAKSEPPADPQRQRLLTAQQLLDKARAEIRATLPAAPAEQPPAAQTAATPETAPKTAEDSKSPDAAAKAAPSPVTTVTEETRRHVDLSVQYLSDLRRLFFSIVEHLRETAQRQSQLNDDTNKSAALTNPVEGKTSAGPLAARQQELQTLSTAIADGLRQQGDQPSPAGSNQVPSDQQESQKAGELLKQAAQLVSAGADEMKKAAESLTQTEVQWKPARDGQAAAIAKLLEALALLEPPQPQEPQPPQQNPGSQEGEKEKKPEPKPQPKSGTDAARLLQAVRERESQRKKDQAQQRMQNEPVDKDW
jgi:Ca-activated chloride channel family protein